MRFATLALDLSPSARQFDARAAPKRRRPLITQIQPLPRWVRLSHTDHSAAVFSTGAGLALFDQIRPGATAPMFRAPQRTSPSRSSPAACASVSRSNPPNPARRFYGCAKTRPRYVTPNIFQAAPSPAGRLHRLFRLYASLPGGRRRGGLARGGCSGCRRARRRGARPAQGGGAGQRRRHNTLP
jgi:hypothetical protein